VGLSEQSALTRCVRRWCGATPSAVRVGGPGSPVGVLPDGPGKEVHPRTGTKSRRAGKTAALLDAPVRR
jgi:AraC-like DNA-binding protein